MNPRTGQLRIEILDAASNVSQNWAINARASELFHQRMVAFVCPTVSKTTTKIALQDGINVDIVDMQGNAVPAGVMQAGHPCWFMYDADISKFRLCFGGTGNYFDTVPVFTVLWWPGNRANIPTGYVASDGQLGDRALTPSVWEGVANGVVPSVSDATWLADVTQRGCYSTGDGATSFRFPDLNGKQAGSRAVVLRGDGTDSAGVAGAVQGDAIRNITGTTGRFAAHTSGSAPEGAFYNAGAGQKPSGSFDGSGYMVVAGFDASRVVPTANENRMVNATGCYIIKLFGAVMNAGTLDAAALAAAKLDKTEFYGRGGDVGAYTFRNKIINGGCLVAQRGTITVANNTELAYGGADRIGAAISFASGTATLQQVPTSAFTSRFAQCATLNTTGTGLVVFGTRLELRDALVLRNKPVTFSCKLWHNAGESLTARVRVRKADAPDNFSARTLIVTGNPTPCDNSTVTTLKLTTTLSESDVANGIEITVTLSGITAPPGMVVYTGDWQLEEGSFATPFERRPMGLELALCERYYQIRPCGGTWENTSASQFRVGGKFSPPFRTTPTISTSAGTAVVVPSADSWTSVMTVSGTASRILDALVGSAEL